MDIDYYGINLIFVCNLSKFREHSLDLLGDE